MHFAKHAGDYQIGYFESLPFDEIGLVTLTNPEIIKQIWTK